MNLLTTPDFSHGLLDLFDPPGLHDPSANGYSHVAVVRLPARVIHIAGQGGEDDQGNLSPSFEEQVSQALDNLQTALRSAHADLTDVARLRILVVDHDEDRLGIIARCLGLHHRHHAGIAAFRQQKRQRFGVGAALRTDLLFATRLVCGADAHPGKLPVAAKAQQCQTNDNEKKFLHRTFPHSGFRRPL